MKITYSKTVGSTYNYPYEPIERESTVNIDEDDIANAMAKKLTYSNDKKIEDATYEVLSTGLSEGWIDEDKLWNKYYDYLAAFFEDWIE